VEFQDLRLVPPQRRRARLRRHLAGYQYEQVMYANASGTVLVVSGARKGKTAGILRGDRYTPIPWDRHIVTATW
jgi:hypothetical protein